MANRHPAWRDRAVRYAWALLFGLFMTVASAWAAALLAPLTSSEFRRERPPVQPAQVTFPLGWQVETWLAHQGPGLQRHLVSECEWMGSRLGMILDGRPQRTLVRYNAGWPFQALTYSLPDDTNKGHPPNAWEFGLLPPARTIWTPHPHGDARRLPIRPLPFLFTANLLIWAAATLLCGFLIRLIRGHRRRRLGLCRRCGYPQGALARCPECGEPGTSPTPPPARPST